MSSSAGGKRRQMGLRSRVLLLVVFVILPLLLVSGYSTSLDREENLADAGKEALRVARKGADQQEDQARRARSLLELLSHVPAVRDAVPGACDTFLDEIRPRYPWQIGLWVIRPDGSMACSTVPGGVTVNVADRSYFQRALRTKDFTVSDYLIVKLRRRPAMLAVLPSVDDAGVVERLFMVTLEPFWMGDIGRDARGARIALVDDQGAVLARYPEADAGDGLVPDAAALKRMRDAPQGILELARPDGPTYLAGYARIAGTQSSILVAFDKADIVAAVDRELYGALAVLLALALVVGLIAWIGSEIFLLRWIRVLATTAERIGAGERGARAIVPRSAAELHTLAGAVNEMADRLAIREAQLMESESRLRGFAANMPGLAYQCLRRHDGRMVFPYFSEATRELFGLEPAVAQARPRLLLRLIHPDDLRPLLAALTRASIEGSDWSRQFRVRARDGRYRWLKGITTTRRLPDGAVVWDGLAVDITEQKVVEAQIRESEAHFAALAANLPGILFQRCRRSDGTIGYTYFSDGVEPIFGMTAAEVIAEPARFWARIDPEHAVRLRRSIAIAEARLAPWRDEFRYYDKHGTERWMSTVALPRRREDGQLIWDGLSIDITDRKQAESTMMVAKEAAEAANRAKTDFLASVSHELRTPLNAIIGFADLMLEHEMPADEWQRYVVLQREAGRSLAQVISDILDFSKIEAGRLDIERAGFDLHALLPAAFDMVRQSAEEKGLHLELRIDPRVPVRVSGDAARVRQVLLNLLSNAVKFTRQGRVDLRVAPGTEGRVLFLVVDSGVGIPADKLQFLFQKFSQVHDQASPHYGGTGLGLAISKHLVELMGGSIGVDSMPGLGSSFWFELPLDADEDEAEPAPLLPPPEARRRGLRILVAEDVPVNQVLIQSILAKAGHAVTIVGDGREAVASARDADYDLVLMDLQMPEMDGITATREIRALGGARSGVPIVALTASTMTTEVERCLAAGMNAHLSKPIEMDKLFAAIARHAARQRADAPVA